MAAEDRRELVLAAATRVFASGGYAATSTDAIAREAGVSQPYVIRLFGTKLDLFVEVLTRACGRVEQVFADEIAAGFDPNSDADAARLASSYTQLLGDTDSLRVMMHGFSAASVPEIGRAARDRMDRIVATLGRTGWDQDKLVDFVAHGMLLNVLASIGATPQMGGALGELAASCLPPTP